MMYLRAFGHGFLLNFNSAMISSRVALRSVHSMKPNPEIQEFLAQTLFRFTGESSTTLSKGKLFCQKYREMNEEKRFQLLSTLVSNFGLNAESAKKMIEDSQHLSAVDPVSLVKFAHLAKTSLTPGYLPLLKMVGHLDKGVKFLADMRTDCLDMIKSHNDEVVVANLRYLSETLLELLSTWFSVGNLQLVRVTWESPASLLEKVSEVEAVHRIRELADIKQRVGKYRRCFVFTHINMPGEPIVVLHVALTDKISNSIQAIVEGSIDQKRPELRENINSALFYSVTSTQKGLHGIELGNLLIKRVVEGLLAEYSGTITQFSSLSPIFGFRSWLMALLKHQDPLRQPLRRMLADLLNVDESVSFQKLSSLLAVSNWYHDEMVREQLRQPLLKLCAHYLLKEKHRKFATNSVAHFHLRNGAVVWRINYGGDTSANGMEQSCGLMVNYRYYLDYTDRYSEDYVRRHFIHADPQVLSLLDVEDIPTAKL